MDKPDLYGILGVERTASAEAIERAYSRRARDTHPDRGGSDEAFEPVRAAYEVLSDQERRQKYDETGDTDPKSEDLTFKAIATYLARELASVVNEMGRRGGDPTITDLVSQMRLNLAERE